MTAMSLSPERRSMIFWTGCAMIAVGVLLHVPMLAEARAMGNRLVGMPADAPMIGGMVLILLGAPLAFFGALAGKRVHVGEDAVRFEAQPNTPIGAAQIVVLLVLVIGLVIDVMKPATLGFVLPGLAREYGISKATAALLPFCALTGTTVGSFVWGWLADAYGRRTSIILSTILFVSTSICGAMPAFWLNLVMCFLMGASAGGMLPVVYTLLAEIMPPRHRSWVLVLVGGSGLVGGYLAASAAAHAFEPSYGWRSLWLQGFPSGLLLLALSRFIPESPGFLLAQGDVEGLARLERRLGIVEVKPDMSVAHVAPPRGQLTAALVVAAVAWSFINFGLLLWLPADLQQRGFDSAAASGVLAKSSLIALPTIALTAWLYSQWSTRWTLVAMLAVMLAGLLGTLLPPPVLARQPILMTVIALLIIGTNGLIAVLLPYAAEITPLARRGSGTGLIAGSSKVGGVAVQGFALAGLIPTLGGAAIGLIAPTIAAMALMAWAGRETHGTTLAALETG
ncbi:MFS transporter [Sphingomonas sp.]|uniref:MFS transporter n=1 Tax=Sphingomonas sp. TaxID=28214 RepID=UPI00286CE996|nr:MFS transporter [Sphingomonas sp.]